MCWIPCIFAAMTITSWIRVRSLKVPDFFLQLINSYFLINSLNRAVCVVMASASAAAAASSLKRSNSSTSGEGDELIITPLGAGNEVGRSCVYMSFKGKTVMVGSLTVFLCVCYLKLSLMASPWISLTVAFIQLSPEWLHCPTLTRSILLTLIFF